MLTFLKEYNSPVPTLLTTSGNGITGTWSPAVVDLGVTTVYTFTPDPGQCANQQVLNLSFSPSPTVNLRDTICSGLLPHTWNGVVFNADGIQSTTFATVAGCDSTVVMQLIVVPNLTSTTTITLCSAAFSSYTWNGIPITAANTYTFNTTTASGCDSIATLVVNEALTLTSTTNVTICEDQLPYTWNSIDRTTGGTYTFNTTNAYGCDSIATLNLTVIPTATSTENLVICPDQAPYNWNGTSYTTDGIYTVTLTSVLTGCDSLVTLNLTIRPDLSSITDSTICFEQMASFSWNGVTNISYSANQTFTAINLTSAVTGCDSTAILNLSIIPAITSTTNVTICTNQLPYSWNG